MPQQNEKIAFSVFYILFVQIIVHFLWSSKAQEQTQNFKYFVFGQFSQDMNKEMNVKIVKVKANIGCMILNLIMLVIQPLYPVNQIFIPSNGSI